MTTTTRADGTTEVTDYNSDGTVSDQKDGNSHTILAYTYDPLARVSTVTDAVSDVTTYTYDGDGNILTKQDQGGTCTGTLSHCTTYTWDAANELLTQSFSDSGSSGENVSIPAYNSAGTGGYDADGQRLKLTDGTGTSTWAYDSLHRVTSYTNGNGATVAYGYTYGAGPSYDLKNQVRSIAYPNSAGTVTQTWDADGTSTAVSDWNSKSTIVWLRRRQQRDDPNGPEHHQRHRHVRFQRGGSADVDLGQQRLDPVLGHVHARQCGPARLATARRRAIRPNYKYTGLNQLCYAASATSNACSSAPANSYPYALDASDNLTTMENAAHSGTNTQAFNNADQLISVGCLDHDGVQRVSAVVDHLVLRRHEGEPDQRGSQFRERHVRNVRPGQPPDRDSDWNRVVLHEPDDCGDLRL